MTKKLIVHTAVAIGVVCIVLLCFMGTGCGPLSPHVNVEGTIDGKVDTSGTTTIKIDLSALQALFLTECQVILGPTATPDQVNSCAASLFTGFFKILGGT